MYEHHIENLASSLVEAGLATDCQQVEQALAQYWADKVAVVWTNDDVHSIQDDFDDDEQTSSLTEEQTINVLQKAFDKHDPEQGITSGKFTFLERRTMQLMVIQDSEKSVGAVSVHRVFQDSDRLKIGNLDAQVGMELANGYKIVKVNSKSAIAKRDNHTEKFFDPTSIFYTEAIAWGFSGKAGIDGQAENLAAKVRNFERGIEAYQKFQEYGCVLPLNEPLEKAGYDFAKDVQVLRKSAITLAIAKSIN